MQMQLYSYFLVIWVKICLEVMDVNIKLPPNLARVSAAS